MRIAVWHNLPSGGGKRALYDHVKGLIKRGHYLEAWCPSAADNQFLPLSDLCMEHILPVPMAESRPSYGSVPGRFLALLRSTKRRLNAMERHCEEAAKQIGMDSFDLLFAGSCRFFRTTPIAKHVKIPSVLYLGEPYRLFYEALPNPPWAALPPSSAGIHPWSSFKRFANDQVRIRNMRLQVREEAINARAFSRILVNSVFSRESVLRAYGLESKVCYLGIDLSRFNVPYSKPGFYVVGLGSVEYIKGLDRAIRAVASIPKPQRPDLVWIGNYSDPSYEKNMRSLATTCGVALTIHVALPECEVVQLLSRALAMIYTSRLEPFGLAPLEANACGVPVVGIAEGGVKESIKDGINGLLVNDDDPIALGRAVMRLMGDDPALGGIRTTSREFAAFEWSMEAAISRLELQLYNILTKELH
jgi:glycosyltransferase involved in cell wall biosynthesis